MARPYYYSSLISRHSLAIALALPPMLVIACTNTDGVEQDQTGKVNQAVDVGTLAIQRKAAKPEALVLGKATSAILTMPGGIAQYQTYTNGVIVWTQDNGAIILTQAIFDKWLSLQGQTALDSGTDLYAYLGLPQSDYTTVGGSTQARFDRGLIVVDPSGSRVTYGALYTRYASLAATLGLPRSDEAAEGAGGIFQVFENGELHYRSDLVEAYGVWGPVLTRWKALGGATGSLGFPKSDPASVNTTAGVQIGLKGLFENGTIYQSGATGAWELYAGDLLKSYEGTYGGPAGWLGFPIGAQGVAASGDSYVDFQNGILVNHQIAGSWHVMPFKDLTFKYDRVVGYGGDCACVFGVCACGAQDVYTYLNLSTNSGVILNGWRYPGDGDCGDDCTVGASWPLGVARSNLSVNAWLQAWDADDSSDDDQLGTVQATYDINNLWGYYDSHDHWNAYNSDASMMATFYVQPGEHPYDSSDFRGQMWWSFVNFDTAQLSYDQFAATFTDVDPDETWLHPLNKLFYKWVYKGVAKNGNCFGMSLESIYAQEGLASYSEPIHEQFPEHTGIRLTDPPQPGGVISLESEINVKHGYQVGLNTVLWFLANGLANIATRGMPDPNTNWAATFALDTAGEYTIISMFDTWLFGKGHNIRPYSWETEIIPSGNCGILPCQAIHIADPNYPSPASTNDDKLVFDPGQDSFTYNHDPDYSGSAFTGGHMLFIPYRLLHSDQVTPMAVFTNPIELINDGISILVGSDGKMNQITDDTGKTLFEPNLSGPPTKWADIRQDASSRIANLVPIALTTDAPMQAQIYAGKGLTGATHYYDVVPTPGVTAHTPYEMAVSSGKLSSVFSIPGTPGTAERITMEKIAVAGKAVSLTIPSNGETKSVTWTVTGLNKYRWSELSDMALAPTQTIKVHMENAGYRVVINNNGPATSANLRVATDHYRTGVSVGRIDIPNGDSTVEFELPTSSVTVTGQTLGKNGWLVAPVTVTLNAVVYTSLGLDALEYGHDQVNWTKYSAPFIYSDQGATTLYYRARDKDMNQGLTNSQSFRIDTGAPTATGTVSTIGGIKLTYAVTDPVPGSGVAGLHTIVQGGSGPISGFTQRASGTLTLPTTCSAVEFWGEDVAGNEQTSHVKIADSLPPVFTAVPVIQTTHCTAAAGLVLGVTATDDCGVVSLTSDAPAKFPLGTTVVNWTAKDAQGNTTVVKQQVTTDLGDDPSCCPTGDKIIIGTTNNDTLTGTSGNDCIIGLGGQDVIKGLGGDDAISGGDGDDTLWGGDGNDWLSGGTGQDTLWCEAGNDVCIGGDGDDIVHGGAGNDKLYGGQGQDKLWCEDGDDSADGGSGDDTIDGGSGNDYLKGGSDHDTINGGGGNDQCVQDGMDILTGTCHAVSG